MDGLLGQSALTVAAAAGITSATMVGAVTWASIAPRCEIWGPVVSRGRSDGAARYALTFDDGPTEGGTDRILDVLGELEVKAAFFVIGVNVLKWPGLVRRMRDEGHLIGNHTMHHSHFGMMRGGWYWRREVEETDRLLEDVVGVKPTMFRPPMGVKTWYVHRAARAAGHQLVTWNRRAYDGIPTTTEQILERLVPVTGAGDILALHDGVEPNRAREMLHSVAAVRPLVERLRERGLEPARLDDLIG